MFVAMKLRGRIMSIVDCFNENLCKTLCLSKVWQLQTLATLKLFDSFLKNNCCNVVKENRLCFVVNRDVLSINQQLSNRKYTILN